MAPLKRSRAAAEDDMEEVISSEGPSSRLQQNSRKRQRVTETRRQGPFVMTESDDEAEDSDDSGMMERATQAVKEKFAVEKPNVPAENGVIESVHCFNFMCHKNWELKLNPLINFVVGKNGSGKSAALTALTLCLGGKAASTNRATNLKSFISEGQESATLVVKIKNQGDAAYMPEVYGKSIIVERHFNRAGTSTFKLKSENGKIISIRKAELDDICDYYSLQIDNPMNILSQDQARQFLTASTPHDKYKFFVRGVQLEQLDHDYGLLEDAIDNIEAKLGSRQDDIRILLQRKEKAQQRFKMSQRQETLRDRIRSLRRQMAWAQVEEQEKIRDDVEEEIRKHDKFISDAEKEAHAFDERFATAEQASEEAVEAARVGHDELHVAQESKAEIKAQFDKDKQTAHDAQKEQREIQQQVKNSDTRIAQAKDEIEEENQRLADLSGGSHARRRAEIDEKQAELVNLQSQHQEHRHDLERLNENRETRTRELDDIAAQRDSKRAEVHRGEEVIQGLERNRGDVSRGYHDKLPVLLRAIRAETSFRERPIGPIGHHIQLKEQKWSAVLETAFGGALNGFIVTSKGDQTILHRLMQKVGCVSPISIGQNEPIDTTAHEPDSHFKTWLRVLEFDNEAVKRQVVITNSVEQVILLDDPEEASRVMTSNPRPRNVKNCFYFLKDGKGLAKMMASNAAGDMRDQPVNPSNRPPRMKTDAEQQIRYQRDTLQELKRELNGLESQHRECQNSLERAKQALVRHAREDKDLRSRAKQAEDEIDALTTALEEESLEEGRIDVLREELRSAEDQKRVSEESFQSSVIDYDKKKKELAKSRQELAQKDEEIKGIESRVHRLDDEARKASNKRQSELRDKNAAYERINDRRQDKTRVEREHQTMVTTVEDYCRQASAISERVNVPSGETPTSLNTKLAKLSDDLRGAEREIGATRNELKDALVLADEAYGTAKQQVTDLEYLAQLFKAALINRRSRWEKFRSLISANAKTTFAYLLSERGFRGRLVTSHKRKILDLLVEPDITQDNSRGNQATTLSGGEKSFSQICLLLSLWEAMGSPIRALDEFDVYMDAANRTMAMRLLIGAARRSVGRQFIFITPGEGFNAMQNSEDVKFHNLAQPERGQATISFASA